MSAPTRPAKSAPVAGPRFRDEARRAEEGAKRRRIRVLVGAYMDGGAESVTIGQLAERLDWASQKVLVLVRRLEADGLLVRVSKRRWRLPDDEERS